jgi:hypothetical protein
MAVQPAPRAVQTPITDGVRLVNFFNGRLLAAEDLRREQDANATLRDRLGLAVGDGVVRGLRVRPPGPPTVADPAHPVVRVTAGVAVNRRGHTLALPADIDLSLARPPGSGIPTPATTKLTGFASCSGLPDGAPLIATGVYLLTVAPARQAVGRAPTSGLGNELSPCGIDANAEGVQFRIVRVGVDASLLSDPLVRNRLAHLMFGTEAPGRHRLEVDPFGGPAGSTGLLDELRTSVLVDDEVPLACLLWVPGQGITFIDEWCVRRSVSAPAADSDWPELTGYRRRVEGEATFQHFQAELADLLQRSSGTVRTAASDRFRYLPAAGFLPVSTGPGVTGVAYRDFFADTPLHGPFVIDGTHVVACLRESFLHTPIELAASEVVRLYVVRQNQVARPDGGLPAPFLIFTSAHLQYRANGRFNLARWNFSHFAEGS